MNHPIPGRRIAAALLSPLVLGLVGCAGTTLTQSSELEATRQRQEEILRQVGDLRRAYDQAAEKRVDTEAEMLMTLEDLKDSVSRLENQLRDLLDGLARTQVGAPPPPPVSGAPGETPLPAGATPRAQYEAAYLEVTRGHYDLAVTAFEEFLRQNPTSDLADNAVYWIGECHYAQGQYNRAIEAFVRLMDTYPQGDKVPAAMLKLAYAFSEAGDTVAARRYLEELIQRFPDREEAALARTRLQTL